MSLKKKWIVRERTEDDLIQHLLQMRGISDRKLFLQPQFQDRHSASDFVGVLQATDQITNALKEGKRIGLYGDYDCDGIPGTALLWRALSKIGTTPFVYIPKRESGYGLSRVGIDVMVGEGVKLLITIDNGTTALDEIAYAKEKGIEVIVTDHHEPHDQLPDALVLNPKLATNTYPFSELCGTGVVYKLVEGLANKHPEIDESWLKWHLDLVALATICDMVELVGENRIFTKYGLVVLQKTRNVGLEALLKVSGVNPEVLSAGTVGFGIGPRINAAGRMDQDPMLGFRLLTTDDRTEAESIAHELHRLNLMRQDLVQNALLQAEHELSDQRRSPAIAMKHPDWNAGILGLIASKLVERYHKPVFIFDAKSGKGSARSILDYPLPASMERLSHHFDGYGGHALAGGMTLKQGAFDQFKKDLHADANTILGAEERVPHLHIDAEIGLGDITVGMTHKLEQLEPFGIGNPKPLFALRSVNLDGVKLIGTGQKHIRGSIVTQGRPISFVAFGMADRKDEFSKADIDLAGKLELNYWNGRESAEFHVVDVESNI